VTDSDSSGREVLSVGVRYATSHGSIIALSILILHTVAPAAGHQSGINKSGPSSRMGFITEPGSSVSLYRAGITYATTRVESALAYVFLRSNWRMMRIYPPAPSHQRAYRELCWCVQ